MDEVAWRIARTVYPALASVAVIGICLNTLLLVTTIFTKSLRSTAYILIGCCALFDIMHEFGYFIQFPILFSDYYIDSLYCSYMQFIPAMGRAAGAFCVLSIGLDRMLCVVFSIRYERIKSFLLVSYLLTIGLFCGWITYLLIVYWTPKKLICSMPSPFHGDSMGLWSNSMAIVNLISALVYFITWRTLKRKEVSRRSKKIFTSIFAVMIVEVSAWFTSSVLIELSRVYVVPERRPPFHYVACLFVNSGIAVKCLVYYFISGDYRRAIRSMLRLKNNAVKSSPAPHLAPNGISPDSKST